MFSAIVIEPSSNSAQAIDIEGNARSESAAGPSEQSIETENMRSENEFGKFSDATIDFDDEHDNFNELFLNVSASSRHPDNETQSEKR